MQFWIGIMTGVVVGIVVGIMMNRTSHEVEFRWHHRAEKALHAVLLFHSGTPWDDVKQRDWEMLTGRHDCTTRALCDTVRTAVHPYAPKEEVAA